MNLNTVAQIGQCRAQPHWQQPTRMPVTLTCQPQASQDADHGLAVPSCELRPACHGESPKQHMQADHSTMPAGHQWNTVTLRWQHPHNPMRQAADQPLTSSYRGCQGLSAGRCAQLSGSHVEPGADSTTCSAHECRETGEVFSALRQGQRAHVNTFGVGWRGLVEILLQELCG